MATAAGYANSNVFTPKDNWHVVQTNSDPTENVTYTAQVIAAGHVTEEGCLHVRKGDRVVVDASYGSLPYPGTENLRVLRARTVMAIVPGN